MKVLVVRAALELVEKEKALPADLVWLDRLSNGLYSKARHQGFLGRTSALKIERPLLWLRPRYSAIDTLLIWNFDSPFPWDKLKLLGVAESAEVYYSGTFKESELKKGRGFYAGLKLWSDEAPRLPAALRQGDLSP